MSMQLQEKKKNKFNKTFIFSFALVFSSTNHLCLVKVNNRESKDLLQFRTTIFIPLHLTFISSELPSVIKQTKNIWLELASQSGAFQTKT